MGLKKFGVGFLNPITILCVLLGANSIFGVETLLSFNIGEEIVEIPIPSLGKTAGIILLMFPFIEPIKVGLGKLFRQLSGIGVKQLKIEEDNEEESAGEKPPMLKMLFTKFIKGIGQV